MDGRIDEDAFGEELRAAVARLERATDHDPDVRRRAAARMHAAYTMSVAGVPRPSTSAAAELAMLPVEEPPRPSRSRRVVLAFATAAVLLAGVLALGWFDRSVESPAPADGPSVAPTSVSSQAPGRIGAGTLSTDVLGSSLTMTSREPLWLLRSAPGVAEFALGPAESDPSTLMILRPTVLSEGFGADQLEPVLRSLSSAEERDVVVASRNGRAWRLAGGSGDGAPGGATRADQVVDVFEFPLADDETALLIAATSPDRPDSQLGGPFADVIASISIEPITTPADPSATPRVVLIEPSDDARP